MDKYYTWHIDSLVITLRYFVLAGGAWFIFYRWKKKSFSRLKLQPGVPETRIIAREILFSSMTLAFFCLASLGVFKSYKAGWTTIYTDISSYGYPYLILSIPIMVILHDAYFYWTHRLLHHPALFRIVHAIHHDSHNPTPWSAFSFHPLEAIISIGIIPILVFTIPCHPVALVSFLSYMTLINVMGHLGYETFPAKFRNSKLGSLQNTSSNHDIHHKMGHSNFGLYFTFWDRAMKTYKEPGVGGSVSRWVGGSVSRWVGKSVSR